MFDFELKETWKNEAINIRNIFIFYLLSFKAFLNQKYNKKKMDFCETMFTYYFSGNQYVQLSSPGLMINALTIIGLIATSDFKSNNLFKYLLAKAIFDFLYIFTNVMIGSYFLCVNCVLFQTYFGCRMFGIMWFVNRAAEFVSMICEV